MLYCPFRKQTIPLKRMIYFDDSNSNILIFDLEMYQVDNVP